MNSIPPEVQGPQFAYQRGLDDAVIVYEVVTVVSGACAVDLAAELGQQSQ